MYVIWHNPACGTSRNTLKLMETIGVDVLVVDYLRTPPDRAQLLHALSAAELSPRELVRANEAAKLQIDLNDDSLTDAKIIDAMLANPILINRPVVQSPLGVRLCRPSEVVLEILPKGLTHDFTKEDGEVVRARKI